MRDVEKLKNNGTMLYDKCFFIWVFNRVMHNATFAEVKHINKQNILLHTIHIVLP